MSTDSSKTNKAATKKAATKKAATKKAATKKPAAKKKAAKKKATRKPAAKKKPARKRKAAPKPKAKVTAWADVVSRVIGQPAQEASSAAATLATQPEVTRPAPAPQLMATKAPEPRPTTIRFPSPAPKKPSTQDTFGPDEWVSVTYTGEEVFVHGKAGIFASGTTTHLRGKLARELANKPGFRVRRAA
jgi:hypothetical protein